MTALSGIDKIVFPSGDNTTVNNDSSDTTVDEDSGVIDSQFPSGKDTTVNNDSSDVTVGDDSEESTPVASEINFRIDYNTYTAQDGMTWQEFINSSYNAELQLYVYNGYVVHPEVPSMYDPEEGKYSFVIYHDIIDGSATTVCVKSNDAIIGGFDYIIDYQELPAS